MPQPLILFVDDDEANRVVFRHAFGSRLNVKTASSGEEALDVLATVKVGVVVTDMRMPGMSGNELLAVVKERYPDAIRIIITAYSELDPILQAVNEGLVARYIVKPWRVDEVMAALRWACEAYNIGQAESAVQARLLRNERLAMLGSVLSVIMHDVSQPITIIHSDSSRLVELADELTRWAERRNGHGEHDREQLGEWLSELSDVARDLRRGSDVALEVVQRLPALLGTGSAARRPVSDPMPVLKYALSLSEKQLMAKHARCVYRGPDALPMVAAPTAELFQVLINLVRNAAQAVQELPRGTGRVELSAKIDASAVELTVRDNGPGMSADVLARATEEFFTTRPQGTGLGLAQCRRIVEGVGGGLAIDSAPGDGTSVRLTLPRAAGAQVEALA